MLLSTEKNHHGTRCAGEIAAVANDVCGVGVAYEAGISGIKVLDGPMTDSLEAAAFTKALKAVDVYSCSWGPDDDGKTVDGPHHLAVVRQYQLFPMLPLPELYLALRCYILV